MRLEIRKLVTMGTRDEFSASVKDTLAKRVGQVCSRPDCGHATSGPQETSSKAINIGVAAHITAAAPKGPRYDPQLTPDQRSSIDNAIWLCQNCAKVIDTDLVRYSTSVLYEWKWAAESAASDRLAGRRQPDPGPSHQVPIEAITNAILKLEQKKGSAERLEAILHRRTFLTIVDFAGRFRAVTGSQLDSDDVPDMLQFLQDFRDFLLQSDHPDWREIVELLTLAGTLARLQGQHLQIRYLKRRRADGHAFANPVDLYRVRADLVGKGVDRGYFKIAAGHLDEALKLCRRELGSHDQEAIYPWFERGVLHQDRGEYRLSAASLDKLLTELTKYHSSEKRWIAATYQNLGIVNRDAHSNLRGLYHLWASGGFEDPDESDRSQTPALIRQQKKHLVGYFGFQMLLALPIYLLSGLFTDQAVYRYLAAGVIGGVLYPFYLAFFDCVFGLLIGYWVFGRSAFIWREKAADELEPVRSASLAYRLSRAPGG